MWYHRINKGGIWKRMIIVDVMGPHMSHQPIALNKTVQTCQAKTMDNEPILCFWRKFLLPSIPWHTDPTQCQGNFQQRQHLRCIIYSPSWGIEWWSKKMIKYYVTKIRLYQHWTGSFIQECIIMVMPTRNGTFLNNSLRKENNDHLYIYLYIWFSNALD